jgi:hypothetical protein
MKTSLLILIITVLIYLAISFVTWEINPAYWTQQTRGLFIIFFVFCNLISVIINEVIKDLK